VSVPVIELKNLNYDISNPSINFIMVHLMYRSVQYKQDYEVCSSYVI